MKKFGGEVGGSGRGLLRRERRVERKKEGRAEMGGRLQRVV